MTMVHATTRLFTLALLASFVLGGCASKGAPHKAPVEERTSTSGRSAPSATESVAGAAKAMPGAENAGKPGYYTVRPGDTLIRIGLDAGQNWRDIGRWNNLENPNQIEVGQVLRVLPAHLAGVPAAGETGVVTRPVASATVSPVAAASAPVRPAATASAAPATVSAGSEEELAWVWPTAGGLLRGFDEVNNKGLDLGGKAGDPVLAAMDGRVVYSGAGLRGYGNLIILKHNNTYLSAYAHNQTLLVKEDQSVHKGQKIAEMGSSDAERVALHFEIRRQGKPVDPAKYLPAR